ncbi:hypothetical protein SK1NUM_05720 [Arachnia rubra]|nr:hypothetical protein SK1NUM_05720 [Arachnia rubra]
MLHIAPLYLLARTYVKPLSYVLAEPSSYLALKSLSNLVKSSGYLGTLAAESPHYCVY